MLRRSFSIWSSFDHDLSPEDMVLELEKRGVCECEFSSEHALMLLSRGEPYETGLSFGRYAADHNVSFPQGHLLLNIHICRDPDRTEEILSDWIKLFSGIGIKNAVLHNDSASFPADTPLDTLIEENAKVLKRVAPLTERYSVRICLENLRNPFDDAETLIKVIEKIGTGSFGICLDTGHLHLRHPFTQAHFVRTAKDYLHALHISDNDGVSNWHILPFAKGNIEFRELMKALDEIGYTDLFNYEIPGEHCPRELREEKTRYAKALTDYLFDSVSEGK